MFAPSPSLAGALALAGLAGCLLLSRIPFPARPLLAFRTVTLVLFWAGAGAWTERTRHNEFHSSPLMSSPEMAARAADHSPVTLRGWVADDPVSRKDREQFLLRVEEAWWKDQWRRCPGSVRVSMREADAVPPVRFGDRLEVPVRLRHPRSFRNPGAFDYPRYLEGEGIHLIGTVKTARLVTRLQGTSGQGVIVVHRLRMRLLRRLARAFPEEGEAEARRFLEAILLGERGGGEGEFEKLLRKTGVYHILSISGLHFALLLGGLGRAVRVLPGGRRLAPGLVGAAALLYVALSGGEDPILRSAISSLFLAGGRMSGRRISAWDAQGQAGIVLLSIHPLHLFDPGFQLSFAATLGILSCTKPGRTGQGSLSRLGEFLGISAGAWFASMPLLARDFFQVSPVALLLNFAAAPFLSGSLLLGACLLVLPCRWMGLTLHLALSVFSTLCRVALMIPGSFARIPAPSPLILLLFAVMGLGARMAASHLPGTREKRWMTLGIVALVTWIGIPPATPRPGDELEFVALDVGQGDAILLRLPGGENVLVDAGGFAGTDFDVGEKVVVPALLALGVRHLDLVVLTHAHQDHGGGVPAVVEAFSPREIWIGRAPARSPLLDRISRAAAEREIPILHPTRGSLACLGESCFEVLHPPFAYRPDAAVSNEDSLVLRLTSRGAAVLLPGDVEREGESLLLASGRSMESELLKVPHHGSASSSSDGFLDAVHPALAVVSVGEGNLWNHPSSKVLDRLAKRGIPLLRTDRDGAIRISYGKRGWEREDLPE